MEPAQWPPGPIPETVLEPLHTTSKQGKLSQLKQQAEAIGEQMRAIQEEIRQLEKEET